MLVLLKSLKELIEEYGEDEIQYIGFMLGYKFTEFCVLMGNVHGATFNKNHNTYIIGKCEIPKALVKKVYDIDVN